MYFAWQGLARLRPALQHTIKKTATGRRSALTSPQKKDGNKLPHCKNLALLSGNNTNAARIWGLKPVDYLHWVFHLLETRDRTLAPPEVAGRGNPGKLL